MKLRKLYTEILLESMKSKKSFSGEYAVLDFYLGSVHIGQTQTRLKKGWNQVHISVNEEFQKKGYGAEMLKLSAKHFDYVCIPDGRIVNPNVYKLFTKIESDPKYEVFRNEKFKETVISSKKFTPEDILEKIK